MFKHFQSFSDPFFFADRLYHQLFQIGALKPTFLNKTVTLTEYTVILSFGGSQSLWSFGGSQSTRFCGDEISGFRPNWHEKDIFCVDYSSV